MSYILEALNKAEQERRLGETPTLHGPHAAPRRRRRFVGVVARSLAVALCLLALVGAAALWRFAGDAAPPRAASAPVNPLPPPAAPAPVAAPEEPPETTIAEEEEDARFAPAAATTTEAEAERDAPPLPERPLELYELADEVRELAEEIDFSGHMHSDANPESGMVILNGKLLRAGQRVASGFTVEAITAEGAILEYAGVRLLLRGNF